MSTARPLPVSVPVFGDHYSAAGGLPPVGEYLGTIVEAPVAWGTGKIVPGTIIPLKQYLPDSPYRYAMICGKDHVGDGTCGAYLFVSQNLASGWTIYDSSIATEFENAGWSSPPSANPVATVAAATDKGEFQDAWYDPVNDRFVMTQHSAAYLGGQTQRIFTSTDFLTWTEQGSAYDIVGSDATHNGYGLHAWGARGFSGQTLHQGLPLTFAQVHARGGLNFTTDLRRMYGRDCALWGYNTKEMPCHAPIVYFDGRPWRIGGLRNIPTSGGASTAGVLCAAPLSSDLRRWVGPPVVLAALGGSGTDHEAATNGGTANVYVDRDGIVWVTTQVEDSGGDRRVGLCKVSPRDSQRPWDNQPTYAVSVQSGYEAAVAIDAEGLPVPAGRTSANMSNNYLDKLRIIADINFAQVTSTPSNVTETTIAGTPTFTYNSIATTRGELAIVVDGTDQGAYFFGPTFDTNDHSEIWVEVDGLRMDAATFLLHIGIANSGNTWQTLLDLRSTPTNGRFQHYTGSSSYADAGNFNINGSGRYVESTNFRVGLTKRYTADKTRKVYQELWDGDQVIAMRDITSIWTENTAARALIRTNCFTSVTNTVRVARLRAYVGDAMQGS